MANILDRYVLREVVTAWLAVTGILLVILLANEVVGVLERAAANQYPQSVVLELIGLGALQYLSILLPVGLLLGVVLAFGRLYHDSEMAAALACGAGPRNLYVPVGLLASAILVVNNVRDIDTDRRAGKRTLAVRLGRRRTRVLYAVMIVAAFATAPLPWALGSMTAWLLLCWAAIPLAIAVVRIVRTRTDGPSLNGALARTGALQLVFCLLFAAGILASGGIAS